MAIGLGTALAIGAISSGAGSVASGVMKSKAAKKAGEQQARGAQEASRYMQQGLGQLGQLYSPYINSGAGAIGTLGRLTTPGPGARFASYGPPNAMPQPPTGYTAVPRGVAGPYYMAEGGDVVVDQPTLFIAGEAGPERATFQRPMQPNPEMAMPMPRPMMPVRGQMPPEAGHGMPFTGPMGGDIRSRVLAKYGGAPMPDRGLAQRPPMPDRGLAQRPTPATLGAAMGALRAPQMGGTFGQLMPAGRPPR